MDTPPQQSRARQTCLTPDRSRRRAFLTPARLADKAAHAAPVSLRRASQTKPPTPRLPDPDAPRGQSRPRRACLFPDAPRGQSHSPTSLPDPGHASRTKPPTDEPACSRTRHADKATHRRACLTPDTRLGQSRPPTSLPDPGRAVADKTAHRRACLTPARHADKAAQRRACLTPDAPSLAKPPTPGLLHPTRTVTNKTAHRRACLTPARRNGQSRPRRRACRPRPRHNGQNHPLPFPRPRRNEQNHPLPLPRPRLADKTAHIAGPVSPSRAATDRAARVRFRPVARRQKTSGGTTCVPPDQDVDKVNRLAE